jgi:TonB family protein
MTEPIKSKGPLKPTVPPRPSQAGVATLDSAALPPPKPVLHSRKPEPVLAPPPPSRIPVGFSEPRPQPASVPEPLVNLSPSSPEPNSEASSVTIHTFEDLLADLDLLTPAAEKIVEPSPVPPPVVEAPAEQARVEAAQVPEAPAQVPEESDAAKPKPRSIRAQRIPLALPVLVRGRAGASDSFREQTRTAFVLARGAVISLAARASVGESMALVNLTTGKEVRCRVMDVQTSETARKQVELEFQQAEPGFWPVSFPAEESEDRRRPSEGAKLSAAPKPQASPVPAPATPKPKVTLETPALIQEEVAAPAGPHFMPLPAHASAPPPAAPPESAQVIDLATLILADDLKSSEVQPIAREVVPEISSHAAPARRIPAGPVPEVNFAAAAPSLGLGRRVSKVRLGSESQGKRNWLVVGVAAALLVAVGATGAIVLWHRPASNPSHGAQLPGSTLPAAVASSTESPANSTSSPHDVTAPQIHTSGPSAPPAGSSAPSSTSGASGNGVKLQVKNPSPNQQGAGAPLTEPRAAEKPKFTPGMLALSLDVPAKSAATKEEPLAPPSLGSGVPSAISTGAISGISPAPALTTIPQPEAPLPTGGRVEPAKVISSVSPAYPTLARQSRVQGDVVIEAEIGPTGKLAGMKVLSGPLPLHDAALGAVRQWKFAPGKLDGQPVATQLRVMIKFRL